MSQVQIVTGDAVLLDLRPARVPTRFLAAVIDLVLVGLASWGYGYIVAEIAGSMARVQALQIAGVLVIGFGYLIAMETLTRGRTVGAFALGLRAVRDDGGAIRFRHALLRALGFWAVDFAIWTGFCGGLVCACLNSRSKMMGDLMAGTMMIRLRSPKSLPAPPDVPEALSVWAEQLELSRLPDTTVNAARQLVQRYPVLQAYPRQQLAQDLARQVAARTAPAPPIQLEPIDFLAAIVAERRRRERHKITAANGVPTAAELPSGWR